MPTTRAARAAARRAARCLTEVLPADALGLVLYQLTLAHDIAAVAPTCHQLCDAAKIALKLRPFSREIVALRGHNAEVTALSIAADGRIITSSCDCTVKVWHDGTCERTIQAHTRDVEDVALLPGGARFVSCGDDGVANLWTLDGALERTFVIHPNGDPAAQPLIVWALVVLPDGVHFAVSVGRGLGDYCGDIKLYHIDGTLVHTFKGHTKAVYTFAMTVDGQHIISGAGDGLVNVWSVATKSLVSTCTGNDGRVDAVAAMPDGQRILSGGHSMAVRVWLLDGTLENTFKLHAHEVMALVALPDNQHALSASWDSTVKLFNVNDGVVLRTFRHHTQPDWDSSAVVCLALLPDGLRFVSGSADGTACIVEHGLAPQ